MAETVTVLGRDAVAVIAEFAGEGVNGAYSFRYRLTPCCGADATGVSWGTGIACRACYAELPAAYGLLPGSLVEVFGDGLPVETWRAAR